MATTVIHVRDADLSDPDTVYIGRGNRWKRLPNSRWSNPYRITPDQPRAVVISLYRDYLNRRPELLADVGQLRGKRLACWCFPAECHGDVLAALAEGV